MRGRLSYSLCIATLTRMKDTGICPCCCFAAVLLHFCTIGILAESLLSNLDYEYWLTCYCFAAFLYDRGTGGVTLVQSGL